MNEIKLLILVYGSSNNVIDVPTYHTLLDHGELPEKHFFKYMRIKHV